jgi:hypothetical protein
VAPSIDLKCHHQSQKVVRIKNSFQGHEMSYLAMATIFLPCQTIGTTGPLNMNSMRAGKKARSLCSKKKCAVMQMLKILALSA